MLFTLVVQPCGDAAAVAQLNTTAEVRLASKQTPYPPGPEQFGSLTKKYETFHGGLERRVKVVEVVLVDVITEVVVEVEIVVMK